MIIGLTSISMRPRTVGLVLLLLAVISAPVALASYSYEHKAAARTAATGNATVLWGSPFLAPTISYGKGWTQVSMLGMVYPTPNLDGYYTYEEMRLVGKVHVQWMNGSYSYSFDASISLLTQDTAYMPTKIVPSANAFVVLGSDFSGTLTANGSPEHFTGISAVVAAVPGHFGFKGQYRSTTLVFYISNSLQIVVAWSENSQTVQGIYEPACSRLLQVVRLAG